MSPGWDARAKRDRVPPISAINMHAAYQTKTKSKAMIWSHYEA
jgi:hypothetical protein